MDASIHLEGIMYAGSMERVQDVHLENISLHNPNEPFGVPNGWESGLKPSQIYFVSIP